MIKENQNKEKKTPKQYSNIFRLIETITAITINIITSLMV